MIALNTQVEEWIATFRLNHRIIEMQMEGLTHEDTLIPLPFRGNRLNWTLGHLAEHRDWMLRALDGTTLMPAKQVMLYRRGSEPLSDNAQAVPMDTLLGYLRQAKDDIVAKLESVDEAFLMETPTTGILLESHKERSRFERLTGLLWHETYHMGQLELLRQLAGKDDAVLS